MTIDAKQLTAITLVSAPNRDTYILNSSELDLSGGYLKLSYNNDTEESIPLTADMIQDFDSAVDGTQTLRVCYDVYEVTFDITVGTTAGGRVTDALRWSFDPDTSTVSLEGTLTTGQKVIAAIYNANGKLLELRILTADCLEAGILGSFDKLSLFLMDSSGCPLSQDIDYSV